MHPHVCPQRARFCRVLPESSRVMCVGGIPAHCLFGVCHVVLGLTLYDSGGFLGGRRFYRSAVPDARSIDFEDVT